MSARGLSEEELEEMLAAAGEEEESRDSNSMDSDDLQRELDAAKEEKDAEIAEMSPEELFFSRHGLPASTEKAEQDKFEEELEELAEEYKPILRRSDLASTTNRMRQSFSRQAFDEMTKGKDGYTWGGKKRTIRKKNRKGTRTTIRKKQRKNRTRTMRKKMRKSRNSRKSNKAR
jgi:hypothetical protein